MTPHQELVLTVGGLISTVLLLLLNSYWYRYQVNRRIQHVCNLHMNPEGFTSPHEYIRKRYSADPFYYKYQKIHMLIVGILLIHYLTLMALVSKEVLEQIISEPGLIVLAASLLITGIIDMIYIPFKAIQHARKLKLSPHSHNYFHAVRYSEGMQTALYVFAWMIVITIILAFMQLLIVI